MARDDKARKRGNGEGSLKELPSGNIRWRITLEGKAYSGTAPTKKEARDAMAQVVTDVRRGGVVDPSKETLGDYLQRWLDGRKQGRSERTHEIQVDHLRLHVAPALGRKLLQKLSPAELRQFYDLLNEKGLGASSQRQIHQFLRAALQDALRVEIVTRNVADIVKPTPPREREREELPAYTPEEAARFVQACRADHRGALFEFALATGMRRGELCGLRWQDVDLAKRTARRRERHERQERQARQHPQDPQLTKSCSPFQ